MVAEQATVCPHAGIHNVVDGAPLPMPTLWSHCRRVLPWRLCPAFIRYASRCGGGHVHICPTPSYAHMPSHNFAATPAHAPYRVGAGAAVYAEGEAALQMLRRAARRAADRGKAAACDGTPRKRAAHVTPRHATRHTVGRCRHRQLTEEGAAW